MDNDEIVLGEDTLIDDFVYKMIKDIWNVDCLFISNDCDLYIFCDDIRGKVYDCECNETSVEIGDLCENCQILIDMYAKRVFKSIEKTYQISMKDFIGKPKIWRVADYVFKKLDEKELNQ